MYQKNMFKSVISVFYCGPILLSTSGSLQTTGQITTTLTSVKTTNGEILTRNLNTPTFVTTERSKNRNIYVTTTMTSNFKMFNKTEFTTRQEQPSSGWQEISNITRPHSLTLLTILTKVFLPLLSVVLLFLLVTSLALVLREICSRKRTLSNSSAGAMEEHDDVVNYKVHSEVIQSQLTQTKAAEKTSGCEKSVKTCHSQDDSYVNVQTMQGVNYDKISATLDQSEPYNNLVLYLNTTRNVHSESTFLYVNTTNSLSEYLNSQLVFDDNVKETILYKNISEVSNRNLQHK